MKKFSKKEMYFVPVTFVALTIMGLIGCVAVQAHTAKQVTDTPAHTVKVASGAFDGMHFNSANVVDEIWYGDANNGAYYVVYDNVDAGIEYEAIKVTESTYYQVLAAQEQHTEISGTLHIVSDYESAAFELVAE